MSGAPGLAPPRQQLLLKKGAGEVAGQDRAAHPFRTAKWGSQCLLCRTCGNYVSTPDIQCCPDGRSSEYRFENPVGRVCEIITLHNAWSLQMVGSAHLEHTWFPGYAWRVALCGRCGNHLRWRFEARSSAAAGPQFFGLLVSELVLGASPE